VHIVEDLRVGGLEKVIAMLSLGLNPEKYHVEVWCLESGGKIADWLMQKGVAVSVLSLKTYYNPFNILSLARLMRRAKVDIIHTHGYFASTFGRFAALVAGLPFVVSHVHTTDYGLSKRNVAIERILSLFTQKIICVSNAVKDFVVKYEGINKQKICVIYNGVAWIFDESDEYRANRGELGFADTDIVVISVGSLVENKGHRVLLDAVELLLRRRKNIKLIIAGDGPLRKDLEQYVSRRKLAESVFLAGPVRDVRKLLASGDIFVLPTIRREGLGLAIVEAMSQALPVVASELGGVSEAVKDGKSGFVVRPNDAGSLKQALERLIVSKRLRRAMGTEGKKIADEKFTMIKMVAETESLYDSLLRKHDATLS
jgi:glycosyltransferase involved in cell wall biosynthesis